MTSHPSYPPVSALRERMIEDMTVRGFGGNPPPGAAAKSVDIGNQGGMALGAWRSMRTRSTMPSWRCYA
jgi:hypothetical protein